LEIAMINDEKADALLRELQAALAQFDGAALSDQARRAARTRGAEPRSTDELASLLDELESVIVDAPRMLMTTMEMLGAERLTFSTDTSDIRFTDGALREELDGTDDATITMESLRPALANAEEASEIIADLRRRIHE
jgi:hypothetical protein